MCERVDAGTANSQSKTQDGAQLQSPYLCLPQVAGVGDEQKQRPAAPLLEQCVEVVVAEEHGQHVWWQGAGQGRQAVHLGGLGGGGGR